MSSLPASTDFLPAERLSHPQILRQAEAVGQSAVLTAVLDCLPCLVAVMNPERQVVYCNGALANAGRFTSTEGALGSRPGEILHCVHATDSPGGCGTGANCRNCKLAEAVVMGQGGDACSREWALDSRGGEREFSTEYAVEVTPLPQLGEGWLCFSLRDNSDKKRREALQKTFFHDLMQGGGGPGEAAPETEQRLFTAILESTEDAITALTPDGLVLTWNRGAESIFGYSTREAIGQTVTQFVATESLPVLENLLTEAGRGGVASQCEGIVLLKGGRKLPVSVTGSPIKNPAGQVVAIAAIVRDISKRVEAEGARALLAAIVESSRDAIVSTTPEGVIVSWNHGAEALYGFSAAEAMGKSKAILRPPSRCDESPEYLASIQKRPMASSYESVRQTKDGRLIDVELSVSPVRDEGGGVVGFSVVGHDIGKRRLAERKLAASEASYRREFADNSLVMLLIDPVDERIIEANGAACIYYGYSQEQLLSMRASDLQATVLAEPRAQETGLLRRTKHHLADGTMREVEVSSSQIQFGERALTHQIILDITARQRAEQALVLSETRLRGITESAHDAILMMDHHGAISFWNPAAESILGYRSDEAMGRNLHELLLPERYHDGHWRGCSSFLQTGGGEFAGKTIELAALRKDGCEITVDLSLSAVRLDGELSAIGILRDTTSRRQAEQALRNSEEKFRQLAESIDEVFWMMPPSADEMLYISPAYERVWGLSCEDLYKNPMAWRELIIADDRALVESWMKAQRQGKDSKLEYRIKTPDGQEKWIRHRLFRIRDDAGNVIRIAGVCEDITERKSYERDLILAREAADAASLAKSQFLSSMSHEIRTPLAGVIGMTQLLLETLLNKVQRGQAETIRSSGELLLGLINDILDVSKIEAGKVELEAIPFNLHDALEGVVELLGTQAHQKGLELQLRYDSEAPRGFLGDPGRIQQVVVNLVGNAIKFTHQGGVTVGVKCLPITGDLTSVRIAVEDTGIGIPEDRRDLLFQKFQQLDSTTTRKYGGTGLGLAISKQLVELMGGMLTLTSKMGEGTTFLAEIPLCTTRLRGKAPLVAVNAADASQSFPGKRVLLVEDNPINQKVGTALLGKLGCQVDVAANGLEALSMTSQLYDLIFMDCQMPEMDGYEATREIRSREGLDVHTPIVALTANAMAEDRLRCVEAGMDDYISKPFSRGQLREILHKYVAGGSSGL